jgi:hypothetical protein
MSRARPQPSGAPGRTPWSCTVQRTAEVGGWGCQLLYLAIGGCVSNDLFREASACGIRLTTVRVLVRGEFGGDPAVSGEISYEVEIAGDASRMFLGLYARLGLWSMLPNRRCALFYNFWAGKHIQPSAFRRRLAADLNSVLSLLADGTITAHVAARFPLDQASHAMRLAESKPPTGRSSSSHKAAPI